MPSEFTVEIKMDLIIPDFIDATIPLQQCAEEIKNDSQRSIRLQQDFETGASFTPLSKRTISRKGFSMALFDKGVMFNAIHAYKVVNNTIVVGIIPRGSPQRDLVGLIHQEQGVPSKRGRIVRRFLGVSEKRMQWIESRMQRWVNERIQKATHEYINLKI